MAEIVDLSRYQPRLRDEYDVLECFIRRAEEMKGLPEAAIAFLTDTAQREKIRYLATGIRHATPFDTALGLLVECYDPEPEGTEPLPQ